MPGPVYQLAFRNGRHRHGAADKGSWADLRIHQSHKVLAVIGGIVIIRLTAGDEVLAGFGLDGAGHIVVVPTRDRWIPAWHEHVNAGIENHLAAHPGGRQSLQKCLGDLTALLYHKIQIEIEEHWLVFDDPIRPFRPEASYFQYLRYKSHFLAASHFIKFWFLHFQIRFPIHHRHIAAAILEGYQRYPAGVLYLFQEGLLVLTQYVAFRFDFTSCECSGNYVIADQVRITRLTDKLPAFYGQLVMPPCINASVSKDDLRQLGYIGGSKVLHGLEM